MRAVLTGVAGWVPPTVVTNVDLCATLDTSSEWIETRTGILERRQVTDGMATLDLAVEAGRRALESAGIDRVDAVVLATTSPERTCPAVAPEVAFRLGLGTIGAFDLTSACSGFLYGLATAAGLIAAEVAGDVLFIGAEAFTTFVNPHDRATAPIFGDGAGAVVLRTGSPDEPGALGPFDLGSDGERADLLAVPAGGSRQRSAVGLGHGIVPFEDWFLHMDGRPLFVQAIERMSQSARVVLQRVGWAADDIDWFVGHQANARIVMAVAEALDVPDKKVAVNIDRIGNTLSASIPILLSELATSGDLQPGDRVLMSAFGAGLSWGSTVIVWPEIEIYPSSPERGITHERE